MKFKVIESTKNDIIKDIHKLIHNNTYSKQKRLFVVEKYKLFEEVVKNDFNVKTLLIEETKFEEYKSKLHSLKFDLSKIILIKKHICDYLTDNESANHVFSVVEFKNSTKLNLQRNQNILLLDNIQDPGNLGTIIRTGFGLGIDQIILNNCVSLFNKKVIKASMGGCFKDNLYETKEPINIIKQFKDLDYKVFCTTLARDSVELNEYKFNKNNNLIVIGNEGHGIDSSILKYSDLNLKIDMKNNIESLNAAIATSIIIYRLYFDNK